MQDGRGHDFASIVIDLERGRVWEQLAGCFEGIHEPKFSAHCDLHPMCAIQMGYQRREQLIDK
jgi:hypothetical protein